MSLSLSVALKRLGTTDLKHEEKVQLQMTVKHPSCFRFDDFDDAIDEAIEEDIGDLCGGEQMFQLFFFMALMDLRVQTEFGL